MSESQKIVIVEGARTPIGTFGGAFKATPAHELGAHAVREALKRAGVEGDQVQEVVMGCIGQVGGDGYNARRVALSAGLPDSTPAFTVNRLCGSGLQAIWCAAQEMRWNDLDITVGGGDENMTMMPFFDYGARNGYKLGDRKLVDGTMGILTDPFHNVGMGVTAENVAEKYGISRQEQDEFALRSQQLAASPEAQAAFAEEIAPIEVGGRKPVTIEKDEHPKPETTMDVLAKLRPAFKKDGSVTAGNASGINDGAAAVVLATEKSAQERGLKPMVYLDTVVTAAMEPGLMGYTPTYALQKLFEKTGLTPSTVDCIELNEAFAAQACAVARDAKLDMDRVNPYGGAIALGHPVGATGAILTVRLAKHMVRKDLETGIVTMCIGGGQALAALFRRA